mmetsp:Transcript_10102/g.13881  ORF Transcript_10102/g.13881 Transcript_10102/m.13881 type:complete len:276 (-) Transcript_10102:834-1661(-)
MLSCEILLSDERGWDGGLATLTESAAAKRSEVRDLLGVFTTTASFDLEDGMPVVGLVLEVAVLTDRSSVSEDPVRFSCEPPPKLLLLSTAPPLTAPATTPPVDCRFLGGAAAGEVKDAGESKLLFLLTIGTALGEVVLSAAGIARLLFAGNTAAEDLEAEVLLLLGGIRLEDDDSGLDVVERPLRRDTLLLALLDTLPKEDRDLAEDTEPVSLTAESLLRCIGFEILLMPLLPILPALLGVGEVGESATVGLVILPPLRMAFTSVLGSITTGLLE